MPKRRSRLCRTASLHVQQHQQHTEQYDPSNERPKREEHIPANSLANLHQIHHVGVQSSRTDTESSRVDVLPVSGDTTEQTNLQGQMSSEQTNPKDSNQTSGHMTQDRDISVDTEKRQGKRRRIRRKRKRKPKQDQSAENGQSDFTASDPTESRQGSGSTSYYAIRNGKYAYNGVHTDWDVCVRYLKDSCGATFKSFSTLEEAFQFAHGDTSSGEPSPQKKAKRNRRRQSVDGKTDTTSIPDTGSRSLASIEPLEDSRLLNHDNCPDGEARINERSREDVRLSQNERISTEGRPLEVVELEQRAPSIEEIRPAKDIQPPEDVQLQKWKVEPVLLPTALFSSKGNTTKREQTLVPVKPACVDSGIIHVEE